MKPLYSPVVDFSENLYTYGLDSQRFGDPSVVLRMFARKCTAYDFLILVF